MTSFPYLSDAEFVHGCKELQHKFLPQARLLLYDQAGLRVEKLVKPQHRSGSLLEEASEVDCIFEEEIEDKDESVVNEAVGRDTEVLITVVYEIYLSPSYRVPVLYLSLVTQHEHRSTQARPFDVSALYSLLIPESFRPALLMSGVLGALTATDHPVTGLPVYFVHPCRTADAMRSVAGTTVPDPLEYLLLWLGVVGLCVGLSVDSTAMKSGLSSASKHVQTI